MNHIRLLHTAFSRRLYPVGIRPVHRPCHGKTAAPYGAGGISCILIFLLAVLLLRRLPLCILLRRLCACVPCRPLSMPCLRFLQGLFDQADHKFFLA